MYKLKNEYNQVSICKSRIFKSNVDYKDKELEKVPTEKIEEYFVKINGRKKQKQTKEGGDAWL